MIIVEGPDGAGKTTLIKHISNYLNWPVAERVVSKDAEDLVNLVKWVEDNLAEGFQHKIFDRHRLISGPIYSTILRREPDEGYDDFEWLSQMQLKLLYEVEPIIIWCLPPLGVVRQNVQKDITNKVVHDVSHLDRIYWLYYHRATLEPDPIMYDYTVDKPKMVFDFIDEELERRDG